MNFPIYKSRDTDNIRVYVDEVRPGVWAFSQREGFDEPTPLGEFSGDEAKRMLTAYRVRDALSFGRCFGGQPCSAT